MSRPKINSIAVVAEHHRGAVRPVTFELLALADAIASRLQCELNAVVVGRSVREPAGNVSENGFDVTGIECEGALDYNAEVYRALLVDYFKSHPADLIFVPHTPTGWDFAPGLAVDLGASLITAAGAFKIDKYLTFTRDICNGKLKEDAQPLMDRPAIVTVMPGATKAAAGHGAKGKVEIIEASPPGPKTKTLGYKEAPRGAVDIRDAEVIVAAGRGIGAPEHLGVIRELASLFDKSAVAGSRPVCDSGWLPLDAQVGMTGQAVSPKLYIACGVSGQVQHTMAMKNSQLIVAVNTDPNALFCRIAHVCVIADLHKFIPVLVGKIREHKKSGQCERDSGQ